jgi:hypothetical protein
MSEVGLLSSLYAVPTVATVTMTSREAGRGVGTEDTIQRYKKNPRYPSSYEDNPFFQPGILSFCFAAKECVILFQVVIDSLRYTRA